MGMFKDFVKSFKEGMAEQDAKNLGATRATTEVSLWKVPKASKTYRLPAEHEATVYTYDGEPLRGLRNGERFVITAVPADVIMKSRYTGATTSSRFYGNIVYSYKGKIFGMGSSHSSAIEKLMRNGYNVEVEAYINGYNGEHGFPYVVGLFGFVDDAIYLGLDK